MTEEQWLATDDIEMLLHHLIDEPDGRPYHRTSSRSRSHPFLGHERYRLWRAACAYQEGKAHEYAYHASREPSRPTVVSNVWLWCELSRGLEPAVYARRAHFLRDVVGNPFRPTPPPYPPPAWGTPLVLDLARAAWESATLTRCPSCRGGHRGTGEAGTPVICAECRGMGCLGAGSLESDHLAVLADALEESGCFDAVEELQLRVRGDNHVWRVESWGYPSQELLHTSGSLREARRWARRELGAELTPVRAEAGFRPDAWTPEHTPLRYLGRGRRLVRSDLLAHLRSPGPHVRGCWAVEEVLSIRRPDWIPGTFAPSYAAPFLPENER